MEGAKDCPEILTYLATLGEFHPKKSWALRRVPRFLIMTLLRHLPLVCDTLFTLKGKHQQTKYSQSDGLFLYEWTGRKSRVCISLSIFVPLYYKPR